MSKKVLIIEQNSGHCTDSVVQIISTFTSECENCWNDICENCLAHNRTDLVRYYLTQEVPKEVADFKYVVGCISVNDSCCAIPINRWCGSMYDNLKAWKKTLTVDFCRGNDRKCKFVVLSW